MSPQGGFVPVILESPFAGKSTAERIRNLHYLRGAIRDCLKRGEAPFASHAIYPDALLEGVLGEDMPDRRALGIAAAMAWIPRADRTVVYEDFGIMPGMQAGIDAAERHGREVVMRRDSVLAREARIAARVVDLGGRATSLAGIHVSAAGVGDLFPRATAEVDAEIEKELS